MINASNIWFQNVQDVYHVNKIVETTGAHELAPLADALQYATDSRSTHNKNWIGLKEWLHINRGAGLYFASWGRHCRQNIFFWMQPWMSTSLGDRGAFRFISALASTSNPMLHPRIMRSSVQISLTWQIQIIYLRDYLTSSDLIPSNIWFSILIIFGFHASIHNVL